jgi:hypothetical protein
MISADTTSPNYYVFNGCIHVFNDDRTGIMTRQVRIERNEHENLHMLV